jgi:hypothetical protein
LGDILKYPLVQTTVLPASAGRTKGEKMNTEYSITDLKIGVQVTVGNHSLIPNYRSPDVLSRIRQYLLDNNIPTEKINIPENIEKKYSRA